jgi:hypothetical protein
VNDELWVAVHTPSEADSKFGGVITVVAAGGEAKTRKLFYDRFPLLSEPRVVSVSELIAVGMCDHFLPKDFVRACRAGASGDTSYVGQTYVDLRDDPL